MVDDDDEKFKLLGSSTILMMMVVVLVLQATRKVFFTKTTRRGSIYRWSRKVSVVVVVGLVDETRVSNNEIVENLFISTLRDRILIICFRNNLASD
jgi:hypothetical protein